MSVTFEFYSSVARLQINIFFSSPSHLNAERRERALCALLCYFRSYYWRYHRNKWNPKLLSLLCETLNIYIYQFVLTYKMSNYLHKAITNEIPSPTIGRWWHFNLNFAFLKNTTETRTSISNISNISRHTAHIKRLVFPYWNYSCFLPCWKLHVQYGNILDNLQWKFHNKPSNNTKKDKKISCFYRTLLFYYDYVLVSRLFVLL